MTEGKHEGTPQEEGDDALWRLLARAPQPRPVSPYFARRVLREVALRGRRTADRQGRMSNWLARTWQAWRQSRGAGRSRERWRPSCSWLTGSAFFSRRVGTAPDVDR